MTKQIIIVGSGNAGMSAAIAALERGASVLILEKAEEPLSGGNTKYTAGAMRFCFDGIDSVKRLLREPDDERLARTDLGSYSESTFLKDLKNFNDGRPLSDEQRILVSKSYDAVCWLSNHGVKFDPIFERQSFLKNGRFVFWGGLAVATANEGVGLFDQQMRAVNRLGGKIEYGQNVTGLTTKSGVIDGAIVNGQTKKADAVILASGGFEANEEMRVNLIGENWRHAKVRGTPNNTGAGLKMAFEIGAMKYGFYEGCHATPMDLHMPDFGGLDSPPIERKMHRKICYFLGIMINQNGERFVDEGENFRNYTYAQFGRRVLEQPEQRAWQIFDSKVDQLLYDEYRFKDAHFIQADTIEELIRQMPGMDYEKAIKTILGYNDACNLDKNFDPTILDDLSTNGINPPKSNWAQQLSVPPFRAYPVTGGITFTYGGLKVSSEGAVMRSTGESISGLFACGELIGGVFFNGYPGGSGLTSGLVFGRQAGFGAAAYLKN